MKKNRSTTGDIDGDTITTVFSKIEGDNPPTNNLPLMPLPKFLNVKAADDKLEQYRHEYDIDRTKELILDDIQANIIKPTKHKYTLHCFLRFYEADKDEKWNKDNLYTDYKNYKKAIISWLKNLPLTSAAKQATMEEDAGNNENLPLTSAADQASMEEDAGNNAISLLLSFEGYNFFYNEEQVKQFIAIDDEPLIAFREGLANRCPRAFGKVKPELNFENPIHALVLIATNDKEIGRINALNKEQEKDEKHGELFNFFKRQTCGVSKRAQENCPNFSNVFFEIGMRNPEGSDGDAREWFGFKDGISNPHFFSTPQSTPKRDETDKLSLVLRRNSLSPRPYGCGSFVVFLKLEQDEKVFNENVEKLAEKLGKDNYKGYAAAYLMGRHKNGTPLHPRYPTPFEQKNLNAFDFKNDDPDGAVCPFHAHTRKANPRDGTEKRIVRRGKIYGDKDSNSEKGILFLSYQSSLLNFEHIINNGLYAFNHQSMNIGQDALFANYSEYQSGHKYLNAAGRLVSPYVGINKEMVKFKGGLYFFASSISYIKYNLENCM